jgi:hypothetical protein
VNGAVLHGEYDKVTTISMELPESFKRYYDNDFFLFLLKIISWVNEAAYVFWCIFLQIFEGMKLARSRADPYSYFAWIAYGLTTLIARLSWIGDCLSCDKKDGVFEATWMELIVMKLERGKSILAAKVMEIQEN